MTVNKLYDDEQYAIERDLVLGGGDGDGRKEKCEEAKTRQTAF